LITRRNAVVIFASQECADEVNGSARSPAAQGLRDHASRSITTAFGRGGPRIAAPIAAPSGVARLSGA